MSTAERQALDRAARLPAEGSVGDRLMTKAFNVFTKARDRVRTARRGS